MRPVGNSLFPKPDDNPNYEKAEVSYINEAKIFFLKRERLFQMVFALKNEAKQKCCLRGFELAMVCFCEVERRSLSPTCLIWF